MTRPIDEGYEDETPPETPRADAEEAPEATDTQESSAPEETNEEPAEPDVQRGMGHIPDEPDARDFPAGPMLGAPVSLPAEAMTLLTHVRSIFNQGMTSMCVGAAVAAAFVLRMLVLGHVNVPEESGQGLYTWARMRGKNGKDAKLTDDGCNPRTAMKALRDDGLPTAAEWPFDPKTINDELPWNVQQGASVGRVTTWFRIDTIGVSMLHDVMHALSQNYPVPFAMFVDVPFMNLSKPGAAITEAPVVRSVNQKDARGGGHMMCLIGYRTFPDGIYFLIMNSWGRAWGTNGFAWIHADALMQYASDLYVMQVAASDARVSKEEVAA